MKKIKKKIYGKKNKNLRCFLVWLSHSEGMGAANQASKQGLFLKRSKGI